MRFAVLSRVVALTLLGFAPFRLAAQTAVGSPTDIAWFNTYMASEADAWNRGDAVAYSARFGPQASFTNILGAIAYGHEAFEKQHAAIFSTIYKGTTSKLTIGKILFVRPDVAIVDTDATVSGLKGLPPGIQAGSDGDLHCKLQWVFAKEKGEWTIVSYHNVVVSPMPPRP